MTLEEIVAVQPSAEAEALVESFCKQRDAYHDLSLALLAHFAGQLGAGQEPPLLTRLLDAYSRSRVASIGYHAVSSGSLNALWSSFFLPALAALGLLQGETAAIVISPTGMLHARDGKAAKTDCGKDVTDKWLAQFHRGGNVHDLYRFHHPKICSTCFSSYDTRKIYRGAEISDSNEDYAQERNICKEHYRQAFRAALQGELGKRIVKEFPFSEAKFAQAVAVSAAVSSPWQIQRELTQKVFANRNMRAHLRDLFLAYEAEANAAARSLLAQELAKRALAAPRGQVILFLLTPYGKQSKMPSFVDFALQAYGSLDLVELPEESELAEILATEKIGQHHGGGVGDLAENVIISKLLAGAWQKTVLPLVQSAYPESQSLPLTLQIAYRMLASRTPKHTNGTHRLDLEALYQALDGKRVQYAMPWESVAAELCLPVERLTGLADGVQPDIDSYLTMQAWLGVRHFEGRRPKA